MMNDIKYLIILVILYVLLLFLGEVVYKLFKFKAEYVRKFMHVSIGLSTIYFPYIFRSAWSVCVLGFLFLTLMIAAQKLNFLSSINNIKRKSYGSYYYPISIAISYVIYNIYNDLNLFVIPILILSLSDPIAALSGMKAKELLAVKNVNYAVIQYGKEGKTYVGSTFFFISSLLIAYFVLVNQTVAETSKPILVSIFIAISGTLAEALSKKGIDNLLIPLSVITCITALKLIELL